MKKFFILVLLSFSFLHAEAVFQSDSLSRTSLEKNDSLSQPSSSIFLNRKKVVAAGLSIWTVGMVYTEYKWWWQGNSHAFQFMFEGFLNDYSLGIDKIGHFYISHFCYKNLYEIMRWAGYSENRSVLISALIPAFYALSVELGDGFTTYQFAPDDLFSNLMGVSYGVLQTKVPFFRNFNVKWSYFPDRTQDWLNHRYSLSDDYGGHTYWLSCNVHNLLPKKLQPYWPRFFSIALGYGVKYNDLGTEPAFRRFSVGLDYNLLLLPGKGATFHLIKNFLDLFHFPAPEFQKAEGKPGKFRPFNIPTNAY